MAPVQLSPTLAATGTYPFVAGAAATMFLWLEMPEGESSSEAAFASRLLEHGVIVSPGTWEECRRGVEILEGVL